MAALTAWTAQGLPDDPGAWLYRVAYNSLIGDLRRKSGRLRILERAADDLAEAAIRPAPPYFAGEVRDDMLRMLFVCCDDAIPRESRLVLALKTLCGFSTAEIALRLFTSEANVHKRLARARDRLREAPPDVETPPLETLRSRLPSVHAVLYLLFNEGYLSAHAEQAIRRELCDEAIRLATLLAEHPVGAVPETFALLALMHLHAARLGARVDGTGGLLLLEEQDRSLWDRERMQLGAEWLARAASGEVFSRFHAEAGIAAEHCFAPSFRADPLEGDRRPLCDAGAHRPVAAAHAEPGGRRRRVARAGGRARRAARRSRRPPGWPAPTSGTPCWATCIGAPGTWKSRNSTGSERWPPRPRRPCGSSSGAGWQRWPSCDRRELAGWDQSAFSPFFRETSPPYRIPSPLASGHCFDSAAAPKCRFAALGLDPSPWSGGAPSRPTALFAPTVAFSLPEPSDAKLPDKGPLISGANPPRAASSPPSRRPTAGLPGRREPPSRGGALGGR